MPSDDILVIGASGGLGAALAEACRARRPTADVVTLSRTADGLDITDEPSVARAADTIRAADRTFDLVIDATGVLEVDGQRPEKAFKEVSADHMARSFAVNALGPALLLKHLMPVLASDARSVFASLSARIGSIGDNRPAYSLIIGDRLPLRAADYRIFSVFNDNVNGTTGLIPGSIYHSPNNRSGSYGIGTRSIARVIEIIDD